MLLAGRRKQFHQEGLEGCRSRPAVCSCTSLGGCSVDALACAMEHGEGAAWRGGVAARGCCERGGGDTHAVVQHFRWHASSL